ncbi:Protein phosphatase 1 regulatory subunit 14B [Camelus dromedarius]|uniref:Protein phosphatase 1 regulatory subunit 14 n=1 Tax=Camelus dromedarius TaxID=9838 RepID=A0A5N4D7C0_CAMDR|nr:Protein phosphatase 1 regulatory subunit 14B [Camelus dromedarius]
MGLGTAVPSSQSSALSETRGLEWKLHLAATPAQDIINTKSVGSWARAVAVGNKGPADRRGGAGCGQAGPWGSRADMPPAAPATAASAARPPASQRPLSSRGWRARRARARAPAAASGDSRPPLSVRRCTPAPAGQWRPRAPRLLSEPPWGCRRRPGRRGRRGPSEAPGEELEIDKDELLDMEGDGTRAARVKELLVDCYKPTEAFISGVLDKHTPEEVRALHPDEQRWRPQDNRDPGLQGSPCPWPRALFPAFWPHSVWLASGDAVRIVQCPLEHPGCPLS